MGIRKFKIVNVVMLIFCLLEWPRTTPLEVFCCKHLVDPSRDDLI